MRDRYGAAGGGTRGPKPKELRMNSGSEPDSVGAVLGVLIAHADGGASQTHEVTDPLAYKQWCRHGGVFRRLCRLCDPSIGRKIHRKRSGRHRWFCYLGSYRIAGIFRPNRRCRQPADLAVKGWGAPCSAVMACAAR